MLRAVRPTPPRAGPAFCFQVLEVGVLGDRSSEVAADLIFVVLDLGADRLHATDFSWETALGRWSPVGGAGSEWMAAVRSANSTCV